MADIKGLGYLFVTSTDIPRWRELTVDCLGLQEVEGPFEGALHLRIDERAFRLVVMPGEVDNVVAVGWEVRDLAGLKAVKAAVAAAGVETRRLTFAECVERRVEGGIAFTDPAGTPVEVFFGPKLDHSPLVNSLAARFVTGPMGMGHVVLPTTNPDGATTFYEEVLGFLNRGAMAVGTFGEYIARVRFMGVNPRHHSLAICGAMADQAPGLVHLMLEVEDLDTVGRALDLVTKKGFSLSSTLGRHTNDKMISFYVRAPGGWDLEFGCEGMLVDETWYTAEEISADSYWGHDWSKSEPLAAFAKPAKDEQAATELKDAKDDAEAPAE